MSFTGNRGRRQLGELKIQPSDFFIESTCVNSQNKTQPCYELTKQGCEMVANKLTGKKGERMNKLVTEIKGEPMTTSRKVAETFGKEHKDVLETIRDTLKTIEEVAKEKNEDNLSENLAAEFSATNFIESSFKNRGKEYPEFLLTKQGFTLITMGYGGKKAMRFKIAYIQKFDEMEAFIKSLQTAKEEFPAFTDAIMEAHEEPKHYHFSNEINMINKIVLGVTASKFKEQNGIGKKEKSIRPYLSLDQISMIEELQRIDIGLIVSGMDYEKRKGLLQSVYLRRYLAA